MEPKNAKREESRPWNLSATAKKKPEQRLKTLGPRPLTTGYDTSLQILL